jgi:Tfp pilus assembly protein PilX
MSKLRIRLSDERGIALPMALAVLFIVAGLATVAARAAIVAQHQSARDRDAKSAIQAAQSGLQTAIYQTNLLQPTSTQCVIKDSSSGALSNAAVQSDGWCAPQSETMGDNAVYTVQVSQATPLSVNGQSLVERQLVSTGTVGNVKRRATITLDASTGTPIFPVNYAMVARDAVTFKNNAIFTNGGVASNGSITFKNNTDVCGNVTPGVGQSLNLGQNFTQCSGFNTNNATQPFPFQPVDMSGPNSANDNGRLSSLNTANHDSCTGCPNITWSSSTRVLTIRNGGVLTLAGDTYSLCKLDLQAGGQLKIAARTTPLMLYIDTPEACGSGNGTANLSGQVLNVNSNPATFTLLVAGSTSIATTVTVEDNAVTAAAAPMNIYAPNSTVDYKNNLDWAGALVAKTITIKNNATIAYDSRVSTITMGSNIRFYEGQAYKECTSDPPNSTPNSGC